jgi:hypothetical protein
MLVTGILAILIQMDCGICDFVEKMDDLCGKSTEIDPCGHKAVKTSALQGVGRHL